MLYQYRTELKWALIFTGITWLWMVIERLFGLHDIHINKHQVYTQFFIIPTITIFILTMRERSHRNANNTISFAQLLKTGFILTLLLTILSPLTQFVFAKVISPSYFKYAIAYVIEHGAISVETANNFFTINHYIRQSLIATPIIGVLISPLAAIIVKKMMKKKVEAK